MKIRVNSSKYIDVKEGGVYNAESEASPYYRIIDDAGDIHCIYKEDCEIIEEETSEWSGEGLPPVGTVCECITIGGFYLPCKVVDHGPDYAVVHFFPNEHNYKVDWTRNGFRPLKSEKEKEIEELMNDLYETVKVNGVDTTWRVHSEYLYSIGYRKTQQ